MSTLATGLQDQSPCTIWCQYHVNDPGEIRHSGGRMVFSVFRVNT